MILLKPDITIMACVYPVVMQTKLNDIHRFHTKLSIDKL